MIKPINIGKRINRFKVEILYIQIPYKFNIDKRTVEDIPGITVDMDRIIPINKYFSILKKL